MAGIELDTGISRSPRTAARRAPGVLRIVLVGDFRGDGAPGLPAGVTPVDLDDFDAAVAALAPQLPPETGADAAARSMRSLDDLHPESLIRQAGGELARLRTLREQLDTPAGPARALDALAGAATAAPAAGPGAAAGSGTGGGESDADTVARLLGRPATDTAADVRRRARGHVQSVVERIASAHVHTAPDPQQIAALRSAIDERISQHMSAVMHAPDFRHREALWRSVHRLVTGLELGGTLELALLPASEAAVADDLATAGEDIRASALHRLLAAEHADGSRRLLVATDLEIGPDAARLQLLARLAAVTAPLGAPVLAGASPQLLGAADVAALASPREWSAVPAAGAAAWQQLRHSGLAPWIGLLLPRVLLRLPYGRRGEPCDAFAFEEMPRFDHDAMLWGPPAFACAEVLGAIWCEQGTAMRLPAPGMLSDLPAFTVDDEHGGRRLLPVAETLIPDRAADTILAHGVMPWCSTRDRASAVLPRIQSIADPARALAGPWRT